MVFHVFKEQQNHDLAMPIKRRFLIVNREVPLHCKNLIHTMDETDIPPSQQFSYMALQAGGYSQCSFTMSDFNNMGRDDQDNMRAHNAYIVLAKFAKCKERNNNFFYKYSTKYN